MSSSGDISLAPEYFSIRWIIDCWRIFLNRVIYRPLKNISSSSDLSTAQEYFSIKWCINRSRIFLHQVIYQLLKNIYVLFIVTIQRRTGNERINMPDKLRRLWKKTELTLSKVLKGQLVVKMVNKLPTPHGIKTSTSTFTTAGHLTPP
jgi:hypothetical protein